MRDLPSPLTKIYVIDLIITLEKYTHTHTLSPCVRQTFNNRDVYKENVMRKSTFFYYEWVNFFLVNVIDKVYATHLDRNVWLSKQNSTTTHLSSSKLNKLIVKKHLENERERRNAHDLKRDTPIKNGHEHKIFPFFYLLKFSRETARVCVRNG